MVFNHLPDLSGRSACRAIVLAGGFLTAAVLGLLPGTQGIAQADKVVKVERAVSEGGFLSAGEPRDFFDVVDSYAGPTSPIWARVEKHYSKTRETRRFRKKIRRSVRAQTPQQMAETVISSLDGMIVTVNSVAGAEQLGIPLKKDYFERNMTRTLPSGETIITSPAGLLTLNSLLLHLSLEALGPLVPAMDGVRPGRLVAEGDCAYETGPVEVEFRGPLFAVEREGTLLIGAARGDTHAYALTNEPIRSAITIYESGRIKLDLPERTVELYTGALSDGRAVLNGRNYGECAYTLNWN